MTIEPETLMAYADGALDPIAAKRVERAIAEDPRLGEDVARHRALAARLRGGLAPAATVPDAIARRLADAGKVTPLRRPERAPMRRWARNWAGGGAVAASLLVGAMVGQMLPRDTGAIALDDGRAVVRGDIARALDTQLASTQPADAPVRVGLTFRDAGGALCRTFERQAVAGIACAARDGWGVARLYGGAAQERSEFRQAASAQAAMMADVDAMAKGDPMDAAAERKALAELRSDRD
ncbi:MAG: anti-sigma factor [Sphingomonas adhaesiva]|uniref:anti-sigma factor family protein n=1 Tax=Sphingomonas adhaesiva TaxID=28212 RepID=UPI002FF4B0A3